MSALFSSEELTSEGIPIFWDYSTPYTIAKRESYGNILYIIIYSVRSTINIHIICIPYFLRIILISSVRLKFA